MWFDLIRLFAWIAGFFILVIVTQDLQVFPSLFTSIFKSKARRRTSLPADVESIFVETADRRKIEVWRMPAAADTPPLPFCGLIFHGNAGTLEGFIGLQLWFHYLGVTSYSFDYRGIGHSSGWPTERGLELDSDAVVRCVLERENITAEQMAFFGYSIGGAMAALTASRYHPKLLILLAAFTDIRTVVEDTPLMKIFSPFLWWRLPTIAYVRRLTSTNLLVAHGEQDSIIGSHHGRALADAYCGSGRVESLFHESSDHNNLFFAIREELAQKTMKLLGAAA